MKVNSPYMTFLIPFLTVLAAFIPNPTAPLTFTPRALCFSPPAANEPLRIRPAPSTFNFPSNPIFAALAKIACCIPSLGLTLLTQF